MNYTAAILKIDVPWGSAFSTAPIRPPGAAFQPQTH